MLLNQIGGGWQYEESDGIAHCIDRWSFHTHRCSYPFVCKVFGLEENYQE